jgi:hypothetical protein
MRLCNWRLGKGEARGADTSLCTVEVCMTSAELIENGRERKRSDCDTGELT